MKAKAVRLHGANDLRLDEFELPEIKEDEILVKVVSDSVCMSTYKCAILGVNHKRVHEDVADHPAIMGHEMAGDIVKVGAKHQDKFKPGMKFTLQPALNYKGTMWSPGYSYEFFGGDTTYTDQRPRGCAGADRQGGRQDTDDDVGGLRLERQQRGVHQRFRHDQLLRPDRADRRERHGLFHHGGRLHSHEPPRHL